MSEQLHTKFPGWSAAGGERQEPQTMNTTRMNFDLRDIGGDRIDPQPDRYIFAEGCRHVIGYAWTLPTPDGWAPSAGTVAPEVQLIGHKVSVVGAVHPFAAAALAAALAAAEAHAQVVRKSLAEATQKAVAESGGPATATRGGGTGLFQSMPSTWGNNR
jgi:hypothetical protein